MDDTYQIYVNRVVPMTLSASHQQQVQNIHPSPKFNAGVPVPFPGYSIVTLPWEEDPENNDLYNQLKLCQDRLLEQLEPGLFVPVPPESFHLTIADLIWDSNYRQVTADNPEFETKLYEYIGQSFQSYSQKRITSGSSSIELQLIGLTLFPRALVVNLVPKDEQSFDRIIQLRRAIYQNADLIAIGIEQQYDFTGHITLGYFGEIPSELDRDRLVSILSELNERWLETEAPTLTVHQVQLRKFEDMTAYRREPDWPVVEL